MNGAVLLVEPELETREELERNLRADGYDVLCTTWSGHALDLAERARPHLVVAADLDLCRRLREGAPGRRWDRNVPFVHLAPESAGTADRVRAFEAGVDHVVDRPVFYVELHARIRTLLRRLTPDLDEVVEAGDVLVDRRTRTVTVRGVPVKLSSREFELAARLAADPHRVFTKDELMREVWGVRAQMRTRTLDSHASRLRRKLRLDDADGFVVNVWGVGYRLLE